MAVLRFSLCNEVIRDLPMERQIDLAARLGYQGLELAPFTLESPPAQVTVAERRRLRRLAKDAGIAWTGLHWLLVAPEGLSITSPDKTTRDRTRAHLRALVTFCADLGGSYMVHGSPKQRRLPGDGNGDREARARAREILGEMADHAHAAGVRYCLEALAPPEANYVITLGEALEEITAAGSAHLRTMVDVRAAANGEREAVPALIDRHIPGGSIGHIHLNDPNARAPGQGDYKFGPVLAALARQGWADWIGVEPFVYEPDGATCAARAIGYLQGLVETLETQSNR